MFKKYQEMFDTYNNSLAAIANKQLHRDNFAPCLDELRELNSANQVSSALFDQKKTSSENKMQFAFSKDGEKLDSFDVINNSREHMKRAWHQITSLSEKHSAKMLEVRTRERPLYTGSGNSKDD